MKAQVLVTTEVLSPALHEALEKEANVIVCELEPVGIECTDTRAWDRAIENNYRKLLEVKNDIWQRTSGAVTP